MSIFRCFPLFNFCQTKLLLLVVTTLFYENLLYALRKSDCLTCLNISLNFSFVLWTFLWGKYHDRELWSQFKKIGIDIFPRMVQPFLVQSCVVCSTVLSSVLCCTVVPQIAVIGGDICLFFMLFLQLSFTNCTVVSFNAANISKGLKKYKKTQKCLKKLKRHDNRTGEL